MVVSVVLAGDDFIFVVVQHVQCAAHRINGEKKGNTSSLKESREQYILIASLSEHSRDNN